MATERAPRRKATVTSSLMTMPAPEGSGAPAPGHEEIAQRAHEIFLAREGEHGHDFDDWVQAERELLKRSADS